MSSEEFRQKFIGTLSVHQRPPFLFIGSGISKRYYGLPLWIELLEGFTSTYNECFKYEFGYYSSKCFNNPLLIASALAEEFHQYWWESKQFEKSRLTHKTIASREIENAFKIELAHYIAQNIQKNPDLEEEISMISSAVISGILTTNYDDFIQTCFPDFQVEIGQKEAIFADQRSIGELYKIHGCLSKPETLVITNNDYEKFQAENHYLNAKLLTLFAEYPIIFMGYSLSDPNIELVLKNLISCLDNDLFHIDKLRDRLIFIEWQNSPCLPAIESSTYTLSSVTLPLLKIKIHDYSEVWSALSQLPRTLPIKTLRHLQNMVFDFVTTAMPTGKIYVNGMEELDAIENLEVVVGFGNITKLEDKGIIGLKVKDLLEDILFNQIPNANYTDIVEKLLPSVVRQNIFVPFFKYQRECNNLNNDNSLKDHFGSNFTLRRSRSITIEDYRVQSLRSKTMQLVKKYNSLNDLLQDSNAVQAIQRIPYLKPEKIQIDVLRDFLKMEWPNFGQKEHIYSSNYRKCICLLDYLEYSYAFKAQ